MLSAIMITKNASRHLREVLSAIAHLADEIIIVDSGSHDATLDIAREFNAKIHINNEWPGFGPQKNLALSYAEHEWVLALDADEVLSAELVNEIRTLLENPQHEAYALNRYSFYCGKLIQHSGWRPDWVVRLFRRDRAQFSNDLVHEKLILRPGTKSGQLKAPLWHYSFNNFEEVLNKINHYSSLGALMLFQQGKRATLFQPFSHAFFAFIRTYFLKCGFLDGKMGFALAISNAEGVYYKYAKLWHLSSKQHD